MRPAARLHPRDGPRAPNPSQFQPSQAVWDKYKETKLFKGKGGKKKVHRAYRRGVTEAEQDEVFQHFLDKMTEVCP